MEMDLDGNGVPDFGPSKKSTKNYTTNEVVPLVVEPVVVEKVVVVEEVVIVKEQVVIEKE